MSPFLNRPLKRLAPSLIAEPHIHIMEQRSINATHATNFTSCIGPAETGIAQIVSIIKPGYGLKNRWIGNCPAIISCPHSPCPKSCAPLFEATSGPVIRPCSKPLQKLSRNCPATKNTWAEICPDSLESCIPGAANCNITRIFITLFREAPCPLKTGNGIRRALIIISRQGHVQNV